jgi:amino-acid N-acetyltransferase
MRETMPPDFSDIKPVSEIDEIISLIADSGLPVSDISLSRPPQFFGIRKDASLVAVVGLEVYGLLGLLRSLAVSPLYRGRGLGQELVTYAERFAASQGVSQLFLLTTTASAFFESQGYQHTSRTDAPQAIQTTSQFSELCPVTSTFLSKCVAIT